MKNIYPEWDITFLKVAEEMAKHSTCNRLKVGCVITRDRRICGTGYNGTPKGMKHCDEVNAQFSDYSRELNREHHHSFSEKWEVHAEMNAIIDMAKRGESPEGTTIYMTTAPCHNCAKLIISAGVKRVVYSNSYFREKIKYENHDLRDIPENELWFGEMSGPDILKAAGIEVNYVSLKEDSDTDRQFELFNENKK